MSAIPTALMDEFMGREEPPPSRRGPRRDDAVTYQVRVELDETEPLLWRRLELASDLYLNEIHDIIQTAFGWTDSHLHEFASGAAYYDRTSEHYLCPFQVEEGETGVPENEVRLDEVLAQPGDELFYLYDFGDDWLHNLKLESVQPRDESAPRAICVGGELPGPGEDCGGVGGYELIRAAIDPDHPDHVAAVAEYVSRYGDDADPRPYAPTPFDAKSINRQLVALSNKADLPGPLEAFVEAIRPPSSQREFEQLLAGAELHAPIEIDDETATRMVAPYTWLLNRVGVEGLKLTSAGYLQPEHVKAAMAELHLGDEWIGMGNREARTPPVLTLRETAQAMGLLRKHKGSLVLTPRGRVLRQDPVALWWHLAEHMPVTSKDAYDVQAGLIALTAVAAQSTGDLDQIVADLLNAIGWRAEDLTPVTVSMARASLWDTLAVLRRTGTLVHKGRLLSGPEVLTPQGVTFARAALRTWPRAT
ncbi:plasmid pRiA4b ORF-3 family protein [Kribbella antibiotica]|uniref:Plasmid pRiA4b ORF-3 family protein n=1 Tax=Kribbella antibiotica TaxID=190195 RepID=A0A4R4ZMI4_9ACTN|nr:plasmid pRiA4b ORF-3 family protein [Kribbella antibiotica]TDD59326.1 plasmid pRiA4b ORF-3 family protein [Kribbella antibiotica]